VRRLVNGIARDLFCDDSANYYRDLLSYQTPELRTLDNAFVWLSQLGSDAANFDSFANQLDQHQFATLRGLLLRSTPQHESPAAKSARPAPTKRPPRTTQLKKKKGR
jgi:hypothetical protein